MTERPVTGGRGLAPPSVLRPILIGVASVLPWTLLEACLASPVTFPAVLLAILLGLGVGAALGLAAGRFSGERMPAALLLLPGPMIGCEAIAESISRLAYLHFFLVHLSVWGLAILAGATIGTLAFLFPGWPAKGRAVVRWCTCLGAGLLASSIALPVLQGHCMEAASMAGHLLLYGALTSLILVQPLRRIGSIALVAASVVAITVLPDSYIELQVVSGCFIIGGSFLVLGLAGRAFGARLRRVRFMLPILAFIAVVVLAAHVLVTHSPQAWRTKTGPGGVASFLVRAGRRVADFDGDGFGLLFGQRDCALFDPDAHPTAHERPNNGKDDNCLAGDAVGDPVAWIRAQESVNPPPPPWRGDIILVTVDCLRQRSTDGHELPALRALEADGVLFERTYSTSPWTPQSFMGFLAARLPSNIPLVYQSRFAATPLRPIGGLACLLRDAGFDTGIAGGIPLTKSPYFAQENFGQGFRVLRLTPYDTPASEVTEEALDAWRSLNPSRPRFLWIHYFNVHNTHGDQALYEAAIRSFDESLALLRLRLGEGPLIVVTGDHGEAFGEHGVHGHSSTLYDEQMRVPLVMAGGPLPQGRRVHEVSTLRALMPTLVAMVHPDLIPPGPGPYLCVRAGECADLPAPMGVCRSDLHLHGLVMGRRKIIRDLIRNVVHAFDLADDPMESAPLAPVPRELEEALTAWEEMGFGLSGDAHVWPYPQAASPNRRDPMTEGVLMIPSPYPD